jgi:hypothetical protein
VAFCTNKLIDRQVWSRLSSSNQYTTSLSQPSFLAFCVPQKHVVRLTYSVSAADAAQCTFPPDAQLSHNHWSCRVIIVRSIGRQVADSLCHRLWSQIRKWWGPLFLINNWRDLRMSMAGPSWKLTKLSSRMSCVRWCHPVLWGRVLACSSSHSGRASEGRDAS